jgi:hypothetical protein
MRRTTWWAAVAAATLLAACSSRVEAPVEPAGIGDPCTDSEDCRTGLTCRDDDTCGPAGRTGEGGACTFTEDCREDLWCQFEIGEGGERRSVCRPAGTAVEDDFCSSTADCERGLVCVVEGFGGRCRPAGEGDLGDPCTTVLDCYAGLVCNATGECTSARSADGGPGGPIWLGVDCAEDEGPARFYFEVPRGPLAEGHDFFRLPWPNDARKAADGHLNMEDFPHPAMPGIPIDVVDRFLRAMEEDLTGFGTNGAIFFRSSESIDWDTLEGGGTDPTIYFVDLTPPETPEDDYGRLGYGWSASTGGGRYICPNWIAVRNPAGAPLLPGRTYALVMTNGVRAAESGMMQQDADFAAVLADSRPAGDEALGRAWDAYAPFRAFLEHEGRDPSTILVAAVFTTQDVPATLRAVKGQLDLLSTLPVPSEAVLCDTGVASPCDDGLTGEDHVRGCFAADPAFHEIQGRFPTPVYQEGTAPYFAPEDGGGFVFGADGEPEVQGEADICFSLTIPKGATMPAGGWPVVVYAHGTGGDYRSFVRSGVAGDLAEVTLADASTVGFAVLSYDEPQHGDRRGDSDEDPEILFFNFANPRAAYGNELQGAIDGFQAARLLRGIVWDAAASPTGEAVQFDATELYFYGHSQGSTHGALTLAFDASYPAAILSGAGGSLIESLLTKTSPYDIESIVKMALADPDVGHGHPALTVFQTYMEVADAVNYGAYVHNRPFAGLEPKHVLMPYGVGDTYSTRETMVALASVLGVAVAEPPVEDLPGFPTTALPATSNWWTTEGNVTSVMSQHDPAGAYDGHYVSTRDEAARRRIAQFLGTAVRDGTPTVVP